MKNNANHLEFSNQNRWSYKSCYRTNIDSGFEHGLRSILWLTAGNKSLLGSATSVKIGKTEKKNRYSAKFHEENKRQKGIDGSGYVLNFSCSGINKQYHKITPCVTILLKRFILWIARQEELPEPKVDWRIAYTQIALWLTTRQVSVSLRRVWSVPNVHFLAKRSPKTQIYLQK